MKEKYQFLFFYEDSPEWGEEKIYIANSIITACRKFHNWRKNTNNKRVFKGLDYEVKLGDKYIDISDIKIMEQYLR